jgi:glycosyltransferase involved in cell wall biosynthesis
MSATREQAEKAARNPRVSVVMPVYNAEKHLAEAVDSVLGQTFADFEFLIVAECDTNGETLDILADYAEKDTRIKVIKNETKLGLAESLNKGLRAARGEYIARMDADDLALPTRFEKQLAFMDANPNIGVCGTYQRHFGNGVDEVHRPPVSPAQCKANLLFSCDLCHSTLMLRRKVFVDNKLFYDSLYLAEDYELWTRAASLTDFANIPEILGEYRVGRNNVTKAKKDGLIAESGRITANNLEKNLGLKLGEEQHLCFQGWENPFVAAGSKEKRRAMLEDLKDILVQILDANERIGYCDRRALMNAVAAKWRWAKHCESLHKQYDIKERAEIFDERYKPSVSSRLKDFLAQNRTAKARLRKAATTAWRLFVRPRLSRPGVKTHD